MKILKVIFFLFAQASVSAQASSTCRELMQSVPQRLKVQVKKQTCGWSKDFVIEAISKGLTRICNLNQPMVTEIVLNRLQHDLLVQFDIGERPNSYPYFEQNQSTIHLWSNPVEIIRVKATLFHEFLHYADLPYNPETHESETAALENDPIYACHVTGYPEVAQKIFGDKSKLQIAKRTCARVVLRPRKNEAQHPLSPAEMK